MSQFLIPVNVACSFSEFLQSYPGLAATERATSSTSTVSTTCL
jgi:hypothetical protein